MHRPAPNTRRIKALIQDVENTRAAALERKQEAEFRHEVGELTDEELDVRLAEPSGVLEQCDRDTAALNDTAGRFIDALGSEIDVVDEPVASQPRPAVSVASAPPPPVTTPAATPITPLPVPPLPASAVPPLSQALLPPEPATAIGGIPIFDGGDDAFAELTAGPPDSPAEATFAFSREEVDEHLRTQSSTDMPVVGSASAVLVLEDEGDVQEFAIIGPESTIGRADQNQIQIVKPGISRKHAVIEETPDGYLLRDLQSNNGTYVNGERIEEQLLMDGDVVELGPVKLVFRA
ncbi:MAG: FHA domain-containing protein [Vicinamibacterales bacterium]